MRGRQRGVALHHVADFQSDEHIKNLHRLRLLFGQEVDFPDVAQASARQRAGGT